MSVLVVDTSVWVDFFRGVALPRLEQALRDGLVVLAPIVVAELLSAPLRKIERRSLTAFVEDLPLHPTPLSHWQAIGVLRAELLRKGLSVSTPDAHIAQCAIEAGGFLWSKDSIFQSMNRVSQLQLFEL